jgi:hypothetical protein
VLDPDDADHAIGGNEAVGMNPTGIINTSIGPVPII